ncbi:MAG: glycosyltransferase, partial [Actinobacteria bacterium]|nr:glycosyltransferase [Actinomycetota bacterium]
MKQEYPKISIVTPSFNQGKFLEETILSILNQNYPNLEYIIIDGGSMDNSVEIIKNYADRLSYWVSERDNGQSDAVNKGFRKATGEIIGWLNSDDTYLSGCLQYVVEAFNRNPDADAIYGNFVYTNENGKILRKRLVFSKFRYETLLFHDYLGQPAVFFRREVLDKIGYLDESLKYVMDWDFFLRMNRECEMIHINRFLATYRLHKASKSSDEGGERYAQDLKYTFNKNKIKKFQSKRLDALYYGAYNVYSKFQRLYTILKDNPLDYLNVYCYYNGFSVKRIPRFLL